MKEEIRWMPILTTAVFSMKNARMKHPTPREMIAAKNSLRKKVGVGVTVSPKNY